VTAFEEIAEAAAPLGLAAAGLHEGDATIVLLAYDGPAMWAAFSAAPEAADGAPDPLDRWSARVIGALAARFGARAVSPNDRPYPPFLGWAMAAEPVWPSPLGMLVHGAAKPCDSCAEKPCLAACPVGAFSDAGYDIPACLGWLARPDGDCRAAGCRARHACPVGRAYAHRPEQASHHMEAFFRTQSDRIGAD
jgi:hypothetical protein